MKVSGEKSHFWRGGISKIKTNCKLCGVVFYKSLCIKKKGGGKFCSRRCYFKHKKQEGLFKNENHPNWKGGISKIPNFCIDCGKSITPGKGVVTRCCSCAQKRRVTSEETRLKLSIAHRREKNPNWKGGRKTLHEQIRRLPEYNDWRKKVFKKNNHTCQNCGIRSGNGKAVWLEAHHIKSLLKIIIENKITEQGQAVLCEDMWKTENGITLCKRCHDTTKNGRGKE